MIVFQWVEDALSVLGVPFAAGKMVMPTGQDLPDLFLTYKLISSPPEVHADDAESLRSYRFQVSIFSRDGLTDLPDVAGVMTAAGFSRSGIAELGLSAETGHHGLAMDFITTSDEEESESY